MSEVQDAVDAITEQLGKATLEILTQIDTLQTKLDAIPEAETVDLTALRAAAQALDDINPDDVPHPDQTLPEDLPAE